MSPPCREDVVTPYLLEVNAEVAPTSRSPMPMHPSWAVGRTALLSTYLPISW